MKIFSFVKKNLIVNNFFNIMKFPWKTSYVGFQWVTKVKMNQKYYGHQICSCEDHVVVMNPFRSYKCLIYRHLASTIFYPIKIFDLMTMYGNNVDLLRLVVQFYKKFALKDMKNPISRALFIHPLLLRWSSFLLCVPLGSLMSWHTCITYHLSHMPSSQNLLKNPTT